MFLLQTVHFSHLIKNQIQYVHTNRLLCKYQWVLWQDVDPASAPVVMWLNGGPGSTSMLGLFEINGPIRVVRDGQGGVTGTPNPHSWHKVANMIYVDQPVGTGIRCNLLRNKSIFHLLLWILNLMEVFFFDSSFKEWSVQLAIKTNSVDCTRI